MTSKEGSSRPLLQPDVLIFYANDTLSHRQLLTLHNPLARPTTFKVLCTNPRRYIVKPSTGSVKASSSQDIVIRLRESVSGSSGHDDKFKVELFDSGPTAVLTHTVIAKVISEEAPEGSRRRSSTTSSQAEKERQASFSTPQLEETGSSSNLLLFGLAAACLAVILMPPTEAPAPNGEVAIVSTLQSIRSFVGFSVTQQLIASFILGMAVMAILQSA
eukprot:Colp12_sorted_trinity150504_noHs@18227